jgi:DNA modification methylase
MDNAQSSTQRQLVSEKRRYRVLTTEDAKEVADGEVASWDLDSPFDYGLPEIDDRYHVWRVPLVKPGTAVKVGEVVIDAKTSLVLKQKTSRPHVVQARLEVHERNPASRGRAVQGGHRAGRGTATTKLRNTIILGDSTKTLAELPAGSVDLVFTSPPYFNARPDYTDFVSYEDYLLLLRKVIQQAHRLLEDGRFFVLNIAPVLLRRASRSQASKRIAVPFDAHRILIEEGFEFIDDIIWQKPEGAGWATGRGRRFAADRNPLQYKAVPVTEYVLVYRKQTERLIDWHIRNHPDQDAVERSKIRGDYDRTNVWEITPARSKEHPAVFPVELAQRVIRYYSFEGDVVLDPFAGIGTVGEAAALLKRRFVLAESDGEYIDVIRRRAVDWLGAAGAREVLCMGCAPIHPDGVLF